MPASAMIGGVPASRKRAHALDTQQLQELVYSSACERREVDSWGASGKHLPPPITCPAHASPTPAAICTTPYDSVENFFQDVSDTAPQSLPFTSRAARAAAILGALRSSTDSESAPGTSPHLFLHPSSQFPAVAHVDSAACGVMGGPTADPPPSVSFVKRSRAATTAPAAPTTGARPYLSILARVDEVPPPAGEDASGEMSGMDTPSAIAGAAASLQAMRLASDACMGDMHEGGGTGEGSERERGHWQGSSQAAATRSAASRASRARGAAHACASSRTVHKAHGPGFSSTARGSAPGVVAGGARVVAACTTQLVRREAAPMPPPVLYTVPQELHPLLCAMGMQPPSALLSIAGWYPPYVALPTA